MQQQLMIAIGVAAILAVIVVIILVVLIKRDKRPNNVYIVGCLGAGKTKLFYHLTAHRIHPTVTSQTENRFSLIVKNRIINLIDEPGHARVKTQVLSSIRDAKAIIFVIDSETVLSQMSDIANLLYDVLSQPEIIKNRVPVLILGAKTDLHSARPIDVIREELEKEFDYLRNNRQQSDQVEGGNSEFLFLGEENAEFNFDQLYTNKIWFRTCSVNNDSTQDVMDFIEKMVK
ncbi:hypothetical protein TVAG_055280 [Trichomonas vaginalis G3]|uniref:Signal recognition particle receptor subunit beta n=1 Tax=Trichomonas vaginalis (strain ATCC PRA-98 / G3) TaxID=412133 RepID=A2ETJ6_TRIV3|nr:signal recognition particle binding [Trichomonas vaginalis G3]EAY04042.1 hypothetical protein TVAG_055280 [Trichomonas vaginalis G3]KAI5538994.1 signal recognition particle binding [Trichomonas vaginalis G3]|eukprot:XP_001316265.1 hypothetical protein [Trichomonas vaginalis G3]